MKSKRCFKKTVTGMSVLAMSASVIAPAAPVMAAEQQEMPMQQESSVELTYDEIKANDNVLYTVNCGTPDPSVVPNQESERMGLMQSSVDQEYGTIPVPALYGGVMLKMNIPRQSTAAMMQQILETALFICQIQFSLISIKVLWGILLRSPRVPLKDWRRTPMR